MIKSEAEIRRKNTIKELKKERVDVIKGLPLLSDVENVHIKSFEEICKRALACAISASLSSELDENPDPELAIKIHQIYLQKYSVESSLLSKEKLLFTNNYSNNDLIDVSCEILQTLIKKSETSKEDMRLFKKILKNCENVTDILNCNFHFKNQIVKIKT